MSLLDSPLRESLTARTHSIRVELKDFERDFFATHHRKPGKDDIKHIVEIAEKYKEYNKVRDVLSGKIGKEALAGPASPTRTKRQKRSLQKGDTVHPTQTPRRTRTKASSSAGGHLRPDELDPYDAPSSITPRPHITALGPTPQRDGHVMGIFDVLEGSGGRTRSSQKRKLATLFDETISRSPAKRMSPSTSQAALARSQTPAEARACSPGAVLEHLAGTPMTGRHNKHSRTPASDGRKFMLSQFFATPSAVRYASMLKDTDADELLQSQPGITGTPNAKTPLLERVLGRTPIKAPEQDAEVNGDKTPAYLKRSFSFKQRLLSASSSTTQKRILRSSRSADDVEIPAPTSPESTRIGPRSRIKSKFNPRPLSQIAKEIKDREAEKERDRQAAAEREAEEAGNFDDDELDALREMEVNDDVMVEDSQINNRTAAEGTEEPRKWKKKGQKRTTRRVIMRPSKVKMHDPNYRKTQSPPPEVEDSDAALSPEEKDIAVEETQFSTLPQEHFRDSDFSNDELLEEVFADSDDELFGVRGASKSPAPSRKPPAAAPMAPKTTTKAKKQAFQKEEMNFGRPSIKARKAPLVEDEYEDVPTRKINPNAQSHMNFRSLKIRNKNSKARGRGRFGGRGRQ